MIWIVLLILAIIAAYFIYQGLHARHIKRCQHDNRTSEHVPESVATTTPQSTQNQSSARQASATAQNQLSSPQQPVAHESPSLLYADRKNTAATEANPVAGQRISHEQADTSNHVDAMDLTAETATLSSDEVGIPANSSDYDRADQTDSLASSAQSHSSLSHDAVAANAQQHEQQPAKVQHQAIDQNQVNEQQQVQAQQQASDQQHAQARQQPTDHHEEDSNNSEHVGLAAGAVAAGIAGVAGAAVVSNQTATQYTSNDHTSDVIDLELGDSTHNEAEDIEDEHDELLDFGDLTADISEMLKELNLRESDSPRLEINEKEYQQLKTGDPGEVKPEKIENVAGKLRDMLQ